MASWYDDGCNCDVCRPKSQRQIVRGTRRVTTDNELMISVRQGDTYDRFVLTLIEVGVPDIVIDLTREQLRALRRRLNDFV